MNYVINEHPSDERMLGIGLLLVPFLVVVAWLSLVLWDEPLRARLREWLGRGVDPRRRFLDCQDLCGAGRGGAG